MRFFPENFLVLFFIFNYSTNSPSIPKFTPSSGPTAQTSIPQRFTIGRYTLLLWPIAPSNGLRRARRSGCAGHWPIRLPRREWQWHRRPFWPTAVQAFFGERIVPKPRVEKRLATVGTRETP